MYKIVLFPITYLYLTEFILYPKMFICSVDPIGSLAIILLSAFFHQGIKEENMKPWKLHWDIQLYKALEHQYQLGLEILNENLPEIKVELVFRYGK